MSTLDGIARLLAARGVGAYSPDAPLPAGQVPITLLVAPQAPGPAVTLTVYDGPEAPVNDGSTWPRLQVRVRHTQPLGLASLAATVHAALQHAAGLLHGGERLEDCYAMQSAPTALGIDAQGQHECSRNYQLRVHP